MVHREERIKSKIRRRRRRIGEEEEVMEDEGGSGEFDLKERRFDPLHGMNNLSLRSR